MQILSTQFAAQVLVLSAGMAILWSSVLGLFMMAPHIELARRLNATKRINFRHLLSAHLDWLMLAFMQTTAAVLIFVFQLEPPIWIVLGLIFGGWMNAVPYFLRAFGVNAFVWGGGLIQKTANFLGGVSVLLLILTWGGLLIRAIRSF